VLRRSLSLLALAAGLLAGAACRRGLEVPDATYRAEVKAFYTGLAAMQTSQDLLARKEFEHATELVPGEPAGLANLGLLLMRQQELAEAAPKLARAAELAPKSAAIARLQALLESRQGRLPEAIAHWRRAAALDPADARAPYALALEIERQGGDLAEAQRVLEALVVHEENLAARLELARLAAKRGTPPAPEGNGAARCDGALVAEPARTSGAASRPRPRPPRPRRAWPS
jgi:tetratricopeptide (TPR) repeat protein